MNITLSDLARQGVPIAEKTERLMARVQHATELLERGLTGPQIVGRLAAWGASSASAYRILTLARAIREDQCE